MPGCSRQRLGSSSSRWHIPEAHLDEMRSQPLARHPRRCDKATHLVQRLLAWNKAHRARLHLNDSTANLIDLRPFDFSVVDEGFNDAICEIGSVWRREPLYLRKDLGH